MGRQSFGVLFISFLFVEFSTDKNHLEKNVFNSIGFSLDLPILIHMTDEVLWRLSQLV